MISRVSYNSYTSNTNNIQNPPQKVNFCSSPFAKFEIINPELWAQHIKGNRNPYGAVVIGHAANWANKMEVAMARGERLEDCAKRTLFASSDDFGTSAAMNTSAATTLADVWKHGEALKAWYNSASL